MKLDIHFFSSLLVVVAASEIVRHHGGWWQALAAVAFFFISGFTLIRWPLLAILAWLAGGVVLWKAIGFAALVGGIFHVAKRLEGWVCGPSSQIVWTIQDYETERAHLPCAATAGNCAN
ncbi:MAG: hypothetical protein ACOYMN_18230 [Roseimicrobium sp.]